MKNSFIILLVIILFILASCNQNNKPDILSKEDSLKIVIEDSLKRLKFEKKNVIKIYYNLPSPEQVSEIIVNGKADFYPDLLSPEIEKIDNFSGGYLALKLGTYMADLIYCRVFEYDLYAINYIPMIILMMEKLNISKEKTSDIYSEWENSKSNAETEKIMIKTYEILNKYLKEENKKNTPILVIMGGWLESMYITGNIITREKDNLELKNYFLLQKLSLNTILELLSKNQNDLTVSKYFTRLMILKSKFDKIKIKNLDKNLKIDKKNSMITLQNLETIEITDEQVMNIVNYIDKLRNDILTNE